MKPRGGITNDLDINDDQMTASVVILMYRVAISKVP